MSEGPGKLGIMNEPELPDSGRLASISTTAELLNGGLTETRISSLVRHGILTPILRGVYARAESAALVASGQNGDRLLRCAAVVASCGVDAVVSFQDAAVIHDIALLERLPSAVAVTRPVSAGSKTGRPGVLLHGASMPDAHIAIRNGIPVTTVARTVVDLARTMPFKAGVVTADSALHSRMTTKAELHAVIGTMVRWRGIDTARRVIKFADGLAESAFESVARVAFDEWGLPPPQLQVDVGGEFMVGRADFLWAEHNTIAEADGAAKYADPKRAIRQLERDAELRAAGFEVVHFTWYDLHFRPNEVLRWILEAFERQAALRRIRV
jgi:predicted transcriptional regulator of viral defense system